MKKKLVESSLGIKTTEQTARHIDSILKELPKGSDYAYRRKSTASADTEVTPDQRTDVSYITTRACDRDNEIVLPEGVVLDDYRANPIVLFSHDQDKPVGKCLWIKATDDGLSAKTKYTSRPKGFEGEWHPDFVWEMVRADVLRGKSIGFLPLEMRDPNEQELGQFPACRNVITRCLLLEYSVVSIPSNPKALVEAVGKGIGLDFWKFQVVGRVKPKAQPVAKPTIPVPDRKRLDLDPERIAAQVVDNILMRWDA